MAKWEDYVITKISFNEKGNSIDRVIVHDDFEEYIGEAMLKNRQWLVEQVNKGKTFCCAERKIGGWYRICIFYRKTNGGFSWTAKLPKELCKRKTFISYYHYEDQEYKEKFKNLFADLITHKSVEDGDIDSDNSDGYIKQLIQKGYLADTTVLVVLIGQNTKHRKHIDWEISGALNYKVGDKYSGLLGLILPDHPDFGTDKATYNLMPARLADNFRSEYAVIRDWTDDRTKMQEYIELAFEKRNTHSDNIDNTSIQMTKNTNE
ncbi:TIR domain-containing protein [Flavobacterium sp. ENC]|uniref:TIR domain-containing protein n=1 Tax=Flavobacterium sp. ENC TaxID=2897330 RepID=UPI001E60B4A2|nr:TIR domain-containing protein [Flavobacterium sp. ENC]MCD0465222.1 TIR domain-containing protein [Flavobacterium sp. ENC]